MTETWQFPLGFAVIALAAYQIGRFFVRAHLPLISGFLFAGILAGPCGLKLLPEEATLELRWIDEFSLAVIAFAAGSELFLKELRNRLWSITCVTLGLVVATSTLGALTVFYLADFIPFMQPLPPAGRLAVGLLAGAILAARSPSSAIAIVNELRARGPFTRTALGVTVIMDVVVIILFAVNSEIADVLFTGATVHAGFLALILTELACALVLGYLLAQLLGVVLALRLPAAAKAALVLALGFGTFRGSALLREFGARHLGFEILLEPLLVCMIAGFVVTNWSRHRDQLHHLLARLGPPVYVCFFTFTGASLALGVLADVWPVALVLFAVRLCGLFLGSFAGGLLAREPMAHNRVSWMAYVTQAGVGLGLAKEVVAEFPEIGQGFAAMIIAVIVLNQLFGPPLFKFAITSVGEAHTRGEGSEPTARDVVIFGLNARSVALAKQLSAHDFRVRIATLKPPDDVLYDPSAEIRQLADWGLPELEKLDLARARTVVAMISDDEENYSICELAFEKFGVKNLVVQLRRRENRARFRGLGVLIVEPETAVVTLLEQFVRSPAGTSLLLGMDKGHDIIDVELRNPDLAGLAIRDLRLPLEVLILSIHRDNQTLVTRGHTQLRAGDRLTVAGPEAKLGEAALRLGG